MRSISSLISAFASGSRSLIPTLTVFTACEGATRQRQCTGSGSVQVDRLTAGGGQHCELGTVGGQVGGGERHGGCVVSLTRTLAIEPAPSVVVAMCTKPVEAAPRLTHASRREQQHRLPWCRPAPPGAARKSWDGQKVGVGLHTGSTQHGRGQLRVHRLFQAVPGMGSAVGKQQPPRGIAAARGTGNGRVVRTPTHGDTWTAVRARDLDPTAQPLRS